MADIDWSKVWFDFSEWYVELEAKDEDPSWGDQKRKIEELVEANRVT
jgi:hypothetical protein